jgi:hypothetical protein
MEELILRKKLGNIMLLNKLLTGWLYVGRIQSNEQ